MPRQLPWANPSAKRPPTDAFFDDTILASDRDRKRKKRRTFSPDDVELNLNLDLDHSPSDSDDSPAQNGLQRVFSSSPPLPGLPISRPENMRMGVSISDLRDDEWMMVEDEFLDTAKLFTRDLHIAEYENIKRSIEEKKEAASAPPRPVVTGAKLSIQGLMKEKAEKQYEKQQKAFYDLFASQDDEDSPPTPAHVEIVKSVQSTKSTKPAAISPISSVTTSETESEDLNAPPRISRPIFLRAAIPNPVPSSPPTPKPSALRIGHGAAALSKNPPPKMHMAALSTKNSTSNTSRTAYNTLDDYSPVGRPMLPLVKPERSERADSVSKPPSQPSPIRTLHRFLSAGKKPRLSLDMFNEWEAVSMSRSSGQQNFNDRVAESKSGRAGKNLGKTNSAATADDVPTFLL